MKQKKRMTTGSKIISILVESSHHAQCKSYPTSVAENEDKSPDQADYMRILNTKSCMP